MFATTLLSEKAECEGHFQPEVNNIRFWGITVGEGERNELFNLGGNWLDRRCFKLQSKINQKKKQAKGQTSVIEGCDEINKSQV